MSNLLKEPQITENELDPAFLTRTRISSEIALPTEDSTATVIKINNFFLTNMNCIKFMCLADNNGSNTTINGKNLYKSGSSTTPSLKRGKIYTVYYKEDSDCVFSIASAEGNATVSDVLAGKIFSNENDTGLVGGMVNNESKNTTLNAGESFIIPAGYHNGSGKVTANNLVSQTPGNATGDQILQGYSAWVNGKLVVGSLKMVESRKTAQHYENISTCTNLGVTDTISFAYEIENKGWTLDSLSHVEATLKNSLQESIKDTSSIDTNISGTSYQTTLKNDVFINISLGGSSLYVRCDVSGHGGRGYVTGYINVTFEYSYPIYILQS